MTAPSTGRGFVGAMDRWMDGSGAAASRSRSSDASGHDQADHSDEPLPFGLLPESASVTSEGRLAIGGMDVLGFVEAVGTPVFVYDEMHLRNRCRAARRAFGEGAAYASKAFLCRAMAALVHDEGMMIDVASGGEMVVALSSGIPPSRLVLHGSNKSSRELDLASSLGVGRIVVDSFDEISRLAGLRVQRGAPTKQRVLVRVNPGVVVPTHAAVATGQADSKFGFSLASGAAVEAVRQLRGLESQVEVVGLHVHVGSQMFDLSALDQTIQLLASPLRDLRLQELCIGGGLGVEYTSRDPRAPSIGEWASEVHRAGRVAGIPDHVRITAEPGRSITAAAAITCYTVGTIKAVSTDSGSGCANHRTYVSVDGGMSDNPRPALYDSQYEAFLPRATTAPRPLAATVVGKHCESGDVLVRSGQLPGDTAVGDILAIPVTGAYGYSMSSNYNKLLRPPVVFVGPREFRVVARRETYRDLLRLDVGDEVEWLALREHQPGVSLDDVRKEPT